MDNSGNTPGVFRANNVNTLTEGHQLTETGIMRSGLWLPPIIIVVCVRVNNITLVIIHYQMGECCSYTTIHLHQHIHTAWVLHMSNVVIDLHYAELERIIRRC